MTIHPPPCAATDAQVFSLADIFPSDLRQSRAEQARNVFLRMEEALQKEGMTFAHVVRTWFYLDNLLDWYGEFNAVRTAFFHERKIFQGLVPASTGVGIPNARGAALVGGVLAVKPRSPRVNVFAVPSPLQCPALDYHSGFSRAAEVQVPGRRHLYISGTASIDLHGASTHDNDIDGQIERSMAVVDAILASRNMTCAKNTTRAVAYFLHPKDIPRFTAYCQTHGLSKLPVTSIQATVCRRELLFEIELDAVAEE